MLISSAPGHQGRFICAHLICPEGIKDAWYVLISSAPRASRTLHMCSSHLPQGIKDASSRRCPQSRQGETNPSLLWHTDAYYIWYYMTHRFILHMKLYDTSNRGYIFYYMTHVWSSDSLLKRYRKCRFETQSDPVTVCLNDIGSVDSRHNLIQWQSA